MSDASSVICGECGEKSAASLIFCPLCGLRLADSPVSTDQAFDEYLKELRTLSLRIITIYQELRNSGHDHETVVTYIVESVAYETMLTYQEDLNKAFRSYVEGVTTAYLEQLD
jgi:hypothetical protein